MSDVVQEITCREDGATTAEDKRGPGLYQHVSATMGLKGCNYIVSVHQRGIQGEK